MKIPFLLYLLLLPATLIQGQSKQPAVEPDLSKFSDQQLTACFKDMKVCRTAVESTITSELYSRIPEMPTEQLLSCFANWRICGASEGQATGWPISDEIANRGNPDKLLARYWKEPKKSIREGIVDVAYHFKNAEVTAFMRRILAEGKGDEFDLYWPANYLAKQCDPDALRWLSTRKERSQSCMQYATTVQLFGKCSYRPAIPYLITYSLNDACLNIVGEAETDLRTMYRDSPKEFKTIDEMQSYYCRRAKQEDFKVHCDSK